MRLFKSLATAAIISLIAAPVLAKAGNPAAKLSLNAVPQDDSGGSDSEKEGGGTILLLGLGAAAAIGAALALGSNDSSPASN